MLMPSSDVTRAYKYLHANSLQGDGHATESSCGGKVVEVDGRHVLAPMERTPHVTLVPFFLVPVAFPSHSRD